MEDSKVKKLQESAVLVGINPPAAFAPERFGHSLDELEKLAETAGVEVLGRLTQTRRKMDFSTYLGKGKLEELKLMAEELHANLIICDDDLLPAQARNLEKILEMRVIDRTELILDIFAAHARSHEAKLQVELAQLQYMLPRLKRMWEHLDRYRGGIGTKGPGEKQLETDRRLIKKRIADLSKELQVIQKRKQAEVQSRNKQFLTVGLVGYTNAGKSTMLNILTGADVLVEDKLFATVDTRTRHWSLEQGRKVMISDTVGFIEKLPHHLVASFRATLEEASQADLLMHVVDASHPDAEFHIETVFKVLKEIGVKERPTLLIFNKIDVIKDPVDLAHLANLYPDHVAVSAKNSINIDRLHKKVLSMLETNMVDLNVSLPVWDGRLIAWVEKNSRVLEKQDKDSLVHYSIRMPQSHANWLLSQKNIRQLQG